MARNGDVRQIRTSVTPCSSSHCATFDHPSGSRRVQSATAAPETTAHGSRFWDTRRTSQAKSEFDPKSVRRSSVVMCHRPWKPCRTPRLSLLLAGPGIRTEVCTPRAAYSVDRETVRLTVDDDDLANGPGSGPVLGEVDPGRETRGSSANSRTLSRPSPPQRLFPARKVQTTAFSTQALEATVRFHREISNHIHFEPAARSCTADCASVDVACSRDPETTDILQSSGACTVHSAGCTVCSAVWRWRPRRPVRAGLTRFCPAGAPRPRRLICARSCPPRGVAVAVCSPTLRGGVDHRGGGRGLERLRRRTQYGPSSVRPSWPSRPGFRRAATAWWCGRGRPDLMADRG